MIPAEYRLGGWSWTLARYPEVVDACTVTGEADALLRIRAADVRHFEAVVERISSEPFVVRTKSEIVLSRLIDSHGAGPAPADPRGPPASASLP